VELAGVEYAIREEITVFELGGLYLSDPEFDWSQGKEIMCALLGIHYTERNNKLT
jgi:hypothetical protein